MNNEKNDTAKARQKSTKYMKDRYRRAFLRKWEDEMDKFIDTLTDEQLDIVSQIIEPRDFLDLLDTWLCERIDRNFESIYDGFPLQHQSDQSKMLQYIIDAANSRV